MKFLITVTLALFFLTATAQRHKIALFAPLYLDSAFDAANNYRFNTTFPKYLNPGLEFYLGAQAAIDSLARAGAPLEVFVYDTRSAATPLATHLESPEMATMELMIGQATAADARTLAEAAQRKKIPFISATLPNDAGVTENPYYVVLNTTLRSHCEGIYRYLQKYHPLDKITVFEKDADGQLRDYFTEFAKATASVPLRISYVETGNAIDATQLAASLDSTRKNVCVAGSLDEAFGQQLVQGLSLLGKAYPMQIVGMPTWDNWNFNRPGFRNVDVVYTTPFYYDRPTPLATRLGAAFTARQSSRPTDLFYRGYETTLRFALLLLDSKSDVSSNLTRKGNAVFTPFDIQPVFLDRQKMTLDYFENRKLYFIRVANGVKNVSNF
jgi:ABC-type branched-subunit amino acid transport system substrate-binding protein